MQETNKTSKASVIARRSYFWNAVFSGLGAIQSPIILFAVSRTSDLSLAGIITMGFALSFLITTIGGYGIRNYQASDTKEEFSFSDYYHVRVLTCVCAILITLLFLAIMLLTGKYSTYKAIVIVEIVLYNLVGTFEGLYIGRLQQIGRFDVGSIIATIRLGISTIVVFGLLFFCHNIILVLLIGIIISIVLDLLLLPKGKKYTDYTILPINKDKVRQILLVAWPLCIGSVLHNYVGNAPKYLVDMYLSDGAQAISGYIMMPMFIITVLNGFILTPTIKTLGDIWIDHNILRFRKRIILHTTTILVLSVFVLLLGLYIGLPFFSWFYNVKLTGYKTEFMCLMAGGVLFTLSGYFAVLLTVVRKQKIIVYGCIVAMVIYAILGSNFLGRRGLVGAGQLYIIANFVMLFIFVVNIIKQMRKEGE